MSARPKLTVATTFPVHPARGGGQTRVVGLYGAAAALGVDVDVVALVDREERATVTQVRPGLREIRVPKSEEHNAAESRLERALHVPVTDVALALYGDLTPDYAGALRASAADASAVVACHPYATAALLDAAPDLPLLYEAQDVETDLKAALLAGVEADAAAEALASVRAAEALACDRAAQILTCSARDGDRLVALFGADPEHVAVVPNGYEAEHVPYVDPEARAAHRRAVGVERFTALFVGSWHGPNLEAAEAVCAAAAALPDARFLLVGSAGQALKPDAVPANVDVTGPVHEGFLRDVLALADVALNPMMSGSGTNLKMLEYAGAGVPLVSSAFGARGLDMTPGEHYVEAEPDGLAAALATVRDEPADATARRVRRAHEHVLERFDWPVIARRWLDRAPIERTSLTP
ncbi:glycosyltransferase family 4 protein [Baekduia alba]|uniref:glycosyltransferase family 4 protein n=1 Tax=Baekduia alba TaxID=2997333 RepID=UPI0023405366|nr:glycosyltransferase family 4 protein [Baekduia alba]